MTTKAQALANMKLMATDQTYGCYTRQGLDLVAWPNIASKARFVIFADIDGMHQLNTQYGYNGVDQRIRKALKVRQDDVAATGRWFSGDEIVWVISRGDPVGMVERLKAAFAKQGLSATFAIAPVTSKKLSVNVNRAAKEVQTLKAAGREG